MGKFLAPVCFAFFLWRIFLPAFARAERSDAVEMTQRLKSATLANGLRVKVYEEPSVPLVTTLVMYGVGSVHEQPDHAGASHFLEHMLFKGSPLYPKGAIDRFVFRAGGRVNAFTTEDYTGFWFTVGRDLWEECLRIEADRMQRSLLEEKEFEAEKQVVLEEIRRRLDSPWGKLWQELDRTVYREHPYGRPILGWEENLRGLTRRNLAEYYHRYYWPRNTVLVVAGDVTAREVFAAAENIFGAIETGGVEVPAPREEPRQAERREIVLESAKEMSRVGMAVRTRPAGTSEDYALAVIGTLLAGGKNSRLVTRLVEEEKLAHEGGVEIWNDARKYDGIFYVFVEGSQGADLRRIPEVMMEELDRLKREKVPERELERARNILYASTIFSREHSYNLAVDIARSEVLGLPDYFATYVDKIRNVTPENIVSVSQDLFLPEQFTVAYAEGGTEPAAGLGAKVPVPRLPARRAERSFSGMLRPGVHVSSAEMPVLDLGPVFQAELPNGLAVWIKPRRKLPIVSVRFYTRAGFAYDPPGKSGLAHFMGQMLDEGISNPRMGRERNHEEIADTIEFVGGRLFTGPDGAGAQVLSKDLGLALDLVEDLNLYPSFPDDRIERVRENLLDTIRAREDDPGRVAGLALKKAVFAGHPLGRAPEGEREDVMQIGRADLARFHEKLFHPRNSVVVVTGDVDPEAVMKEVTARFASWERAEDFRLPELPPLPKAAPSRIRVAKSIRQAHVALGHPGVTRRDSDYEALRVAELVLMKGPGFTDRLSRAVRDEGGHAYAVGGDITSSADLWPGLMFLYFGTEAAKKDEVLAIARGAVTGFLEEGPSEAELEDAKSYLLRSQVLRWETVEDLSGFLTELYRFGLGLEDVAQSARKIKVLTAEDVLSAARKHVRPREMIEVTVGPEEAQL
jgi:zinc protease